MRTHRFIRPATITLALLCTLSGCASLSSMFGGGSKDRAAGEPTPEQRRTAYIEAHADLPQEHKDAIAKGSLVEGMSEASAKASLGRPILIGVLTPESPENGDAQLVFEEVSFGKKTEYLANGPKESTIFSSVRDTRVRFYQDALVGVDDLGVSTRDDLVQRCRVGDGDACQRVDSLDQRAASQTPG